jgi:hypothetical protein
MRPIAILLFMAGSRGWGQGLQLNLITPCRVVDTRTDQGKTEAFGPPSIVANVERDFPLLSGGCNIPSTAVAYDLNIAVIPPGELGFLAAWAAGTPYPGTSTLNDSLGGVVSNSAVVAAGAGGSIAIITSDPTDLVIDVTGYYALGTGSDVNPPVPGGLPPFPTLPPASIAYLYTNGSTAAWGNIQTGASGALDCVDFGGGCDIVTALVPLKNTVNRFLGANDFSQSPWLAVPTGTPASSMSECTQGSILYDANYVYVCFATRQWLRAALSSF